MSVWLTPELTPVYGGTYFPPSDSHYGQPGFKRLLSIIASQVFCVSHYCMLFNILTTVTLTLLFANFSSIENTIVCCMLVKYVFMPLACVGWNFLDVISAMVCCDWRTF